jgi:hypothetical protein
MQSRSDPIPHDKALQPTVFGGGGERTLEPMSPRQLVQAWVEAFNCADVDAVASFYTADAVNPGCRVACAR